MSTKLIHLNERKRRLRQEIEQSRSPTEKKMDNKLDRLVEVLDDLHGRVDELEQRQLQLVRILNELITRLENLDE